MTQPVSSTVPSRKRVPLAIAAFVSLACASLAAHAAPLDHHGIRIEVIGEGAPVLMIPGLNSGADTWRETCLALRAPAADHSGPGLPIQCHLVQLPGFAGLAKVDGESFLPVMRDQLLDYVVEHNLQGMTVVGHSLGGSLALDMAIKQPDAFGKLVIVDSLPYFAAAQNPAATVAQITPMAEQMRSGMLGIDEAMYVAQTDASVLGMAQAPERVETLKQWGRNSDRTVTAQAMYELMTTDLRGELGAVSSPTLVLGSWAAYKPYGATQESTRQIFVDQYAKLPGVRVEMSEAGYHFLMWDDPQWLQAQMRGFLAATP
ncbi:alpha/beta fold hydrolase [Novilysobacter antarcticus]|uniref:alpha/beta fold hydrolase n=1 Tax=Novilysobacter antarcticus TaxID=2862543 RepID=UPI001C99DFAF|nr:alpha/beta hydrolase [Lysobacter antarcticus]